MFKKIKKASSVLFALSTILVSANCEVKRESDVKPSISLDYDKHERDIEESRASELDSAFEKSFQSNFSDWKKLRLETFFEDREKYNDKVDRLARRGVEYGAIDFLRSSEWGIAIENKIHEYEEKLKFRIGSLKINGGRDGIISFDSGVRFGLPNTYGYFRGSFRQKKDLPDAVRAELRAGPEFLDARIMDGKINRWNFVSGARTKYDFVEKYLYTRFGRKNNWSQEDIYWGIEGRAGQFNNGLRRKERKNDNFDAQVLFVYGRKF